MNPFPRILQLFRRQAGMIGVPPSVRFAISDDIAEHAADFAVRYAEPMDYLVSQRMLDLGIDARHIGSSDLTHGIRHAAFQPYERTGGGNGPGGRLTVDSGIFNPELHGDLGFEVSSRWAKSRLREREFPMIHNLTIGHLDPEAVAERRAAVLKPLDFQVVTRHLRALGERNGTGWTLDGMPVEEKDGYLVCRWLVGPRRNLVAEELALRIQRDTGCLIADREHYRMVEPEQLWGLVGRNTVAS